MLIRKAQSFTLSEMLVVLVLSAIIVSLAMVVLTLVQKQVRSIESIEFNKKEIILLERVLRQDFNSGRSFIDSKGKIVIIYTGRDTVQYKFSDYVLRNKDTLKVKIENLKFYLDGAMVYENEVDAIELTIAQSFQSKELFVSRLKDAAYYMNH